MSTLPQTVIPRPYREELVRMYLAWVNAHLKKRNASDRLVDISTGFQDGVTLLNLVEAVSGKQVDGVVRQPQTSLEREETVGRVLSFLLSEGLDLKSVSAGELVEGNLKVVLKVIYSLACHYKSTAAPQQPLECNINNPHSTPALNEYASLKQQVSEFEKKVRDNALIAKYRRLSINSNILSDLEATEGGETDATDCDSDVNSDLLDVGIPESCQAGVEEPTYVNLSLCNTSLRANRIRSKPPDELDANLRDPLTPSFKQPAAELGGVSNREVYVYSDNPTDSNPFLYPTSVQDMTSTTTKEQMSPSVGGEEREDSYYDKLSLSLEELGPIKQQILEVQHVLSDKGGYTSAGVNQGLGMTVNTLTAQLAELQLKYKDRCRQMSESEQQAQQLSSDLTCVVQECTDLSNRLTESLSIRADVLRKDYLLHNSESENLSLRIAVREKDEVVKQLNGKLALREQLVATLEEQVDELKRDKERVDKGQVIGSGSQCTLSALSDSVEAPTHLSARVKEVCGTLCSLRARISEDPTCSHLLDSVEEGLYTIVEKLYYYTARYLKKSATKTEGRSTHSPRANGRNRSFESPKSRDVLNRSSSSLNTSREQCSNDLDPNELIVFDICQTPEGHKNIPQKPNTRVLYFLNQTDTPSRVNISKSPSEVTLADIKSQNNKPGRFAYHFKVYDPDFGAVKEEISQDSDFVPVYKKNTVIVHLETNEP